MGMYNGPLSTSAVLDTTKFSYFYGLEFEDSWSSSTQYQQGDIVTYGGYQYVAERNNIGQTCRFRRDWEVITTGYSMRYMVRYCLQNWWSCQYGGNTYVYKVSSGWYITQIIRKQIY